MAVVPPDVAEDVARLVVETFDGQIKEFYDPEDVERGYVEVEDRKGKLQRLPLAGVSIGIATTKVRSFAHYGAVSVATEIKQYASASRILLLGRRLKVADAPPVSFARPSRVTALASDLYLSFQKILSSGWGAVPTVGESPRPPERHSGLPVYSDRPSKWDGIGRANGANVCRPPLPAIAASRSEGHVRQGT